MPRCTLTHCKRPVVGRKGRYCPAHAAEELALRRLVNALLNDDRQRPASEDRQKERRRQYERPVCRDPRRDSR